MSNSLAKVHPELVSEWSERNFPLTPDDITYGSNKRVSLFVSEMLERLHPRPELYRQAC